MDMSDGAWLTGFEMLEDLPNHIEQPKSLDDLTPQQLAAPFEDDFLHFHESFSPNVISKRPMTQLKHPPSQHKSTSPVQSASHSVGLAPKIGRLDKRRSTPKRKPVSTMEHVLAERKRREILGQQFIALSAMVPGLKKVDKISIIEGSMKLIEELKGKVKILEEEDLKTERTIEPVIVMKCVFSSGPTSSENENTSGFLPLEIEAKALHRNVMISVRCENHKGLLAKTVMEIGKLNLSVLHCNSMPLGNSTFNITVLTKMDHDFNITMVELVTSLRSIFAT